MPGKCTCTGVQEYRYLGPGNTKALERIARVNAGAGASAGVSTGEKALELEQLLG